MRKDLRRQAVSPFSFLADTLLTNCQEQQRRQEFRDALAAFDPEKLQEVLEWMDRCDGLDASHYHPREETEDEDGEDW
jgi:hypothetical protein